MKRGLRSAFKEVRIRTGTAICLIALTLSAGTAEAMPSYSADDLWNGNTPWGGLGRVVGKAYVEKHGIFSIAYRWLAEDTIGKFTRYTSSNTVTEEHYRLQGSNVSICDKTDHICSPVHIWKLMFSQTIGGSETAYTPWPNGMGIIYDVGTAHRSNATLDLTGGDPTGLADARAAEQQEHLAQNEADYEAFRSNSAIAAQQNAASARETWDSIHQAANATNESGTYRRSHHGAVGASRSEKPSVIVEEAKPERSSPSREIPATVDVYYACEAWDNSAAKHIFYYSSVADIKMPRNFGFPERIKITDNWRNYVTKATGATDATCSHLSIHSMDEAIRKQRESVANMSVFNETVSLNYTPRL